MKKAMPVPQKSNPKIYLGQMCYQNLSFGFASCYVIAGIQVLNTTTLHPVYTNHVSKSYYKNKKQ
ncbi:hypothetical protein CMT19_16985 [Elizabethkingia anophelis]|nr:hypothetical protein [Elizabethkingia anophelis]